MRKFFIWVVCAMVFIPIGADLAVLVGYSYDKGDWWQHLVLSIIALACVVTDGFYFVRPDK